MRGLGYLDKNILILYRWADNDYDRLPALAADLAGRKVDVIMANSPPSALAAQSATSTIPIAFGLAFTEWDLDKYGILSAVLGVAGGLIAYETLHRRGRFVVPAIVAWGLLYATFLTFVLVA